MSKYKSKRVLIVGFGVSGVAVAKYMIKQGAKVLISEQKQNTEVLESVKALEDYKVEYEFGGHNPRSFLGAELIVVSPGVPLTLPVLQEAKAQNIPITTEVDLAAMALKEPLISVTGTNGKTTTTLLIGEIFKADQRPVYVGGNIGKPLLDYITEGQRADYVVSELSSFQIDLIEKLVPAVAVFTNIDQDHLDRYPTFEAYVESKKRLLKVCDRNSFVILNYDDPIVQKFSEQTSGKVLWFTKKNPLEVGGEFSETYTGAYLRDKQIIFKFMGNEEVYNLSKLRLFGDHNKENLMAAICAARAMGIRPASIQKVIDEFRGVPHRLEFVRKKDGVYFFNDSKATNVMSVQKSLGAFKKSPVILISGGKDKEMDFSPLAELVRKRCKIIILIGEAKEKINRALGDYAETYLVGTFEEAVILSYQKSRSGDIILLSPGCASYDMFRNFEERGDYFKKIVQSL